MQHSLRRCALTILLVLVGIFSGSSFAQEKPQPPSGPAPAATQTISSDPLDIVVSDTTAIAYQLNSNQMYFGPSDSGTFLTINGAVFGPKPLANEGFFSTTPFEPTAYTLGSNTLTGTGTSADPFVVVTRVQAGVTGVSLVQTITYVAGEQDYQIALRLENTNPTPIQLRMTHAADLYVNFPENDQDFGIAFGDPTTGAIGSVTRTGQYVQAFIPNPQTPPTAYQVSEWGRVQGVTPFWNYIGGPAGTPGPGLQNIIQNGYIDIVAGFQWDLTVPAATAGKNSPEFAAVGATEVTARGAFGPATEFGIRTGVIYLPLVVR